VGRRGRFFRQRGRNAPVHRSAPEVTFTPSGRRSRSIAVAVGKPIHPAGAACDGFSAISFPAVPPVLSRTDAGTAVAAAGRGHLHARRDLRAGISSGRGGNPGGPLGVEAVIHAGGAKHECRTR
jgi:hypothetical protein